MEYRVPTVWKNREKVGNIEMPFSRSGKSGKSREFNTLLLLKQISGTIHRTEMADHIFKKCSAKEIQTDRFGASRAIKNGRKIRKW